MQFNGRLIGSLAALALTLSPVAARSDGSVSSAALAKILDRGKWTTDDRTSARELLRRGADPKSVGPKRGITVLMFAARLGEMGAMNTALKAGADVNARTRDGADLTALWFAAGSRNEKTLRRLLDAGAEVDPVDSYGRTPLMMATNFKFRAGIELLLARGANIRARNKSGRTVLAYTDHHPGITRLLQEHGAVE
jgi:ankyrin repeat protein